MAGEVILGISPGTRVMGIAIMHSGELIEWRVKSFKGKWSKEKQLAILKMVAKLCDYYTVRRIVVKKVDPLRSSPQLDGLISAIVQQAKRQTLLIKTLSLEELDYDTQSKSMTKGVLSEKVVDRHPELKQEYIKERNNQKEYYTKMFEAIAIAEHSQH